MWQPLTLNNCKFFLKQDFNNQNIRTALSDLINIWLDNLSEYEVIKNFKEYNPLAKTNNKWVLKFITEFETGSAALESEKCGDVIKLTLKAPVGLKYTFNLRKQPQETVYKELTLPLFFIINELRYRQDVLCSQLEAKDKELLEFKLEGYKISRRNVITTEFKRDDFQNECSRDIDGRLKNALKDIPNVMSDVNELYSKFCSVISSSTVDLLKQGSLLEIKKDDPCEDSHLNEINEIKLQKTHYPKEEFVSIKKLKGTKRSIL